MKSLYKSVASITAIAVLAMRVSIPSLMLSQATLRAPNITGVDGTHVKLTAGTVNSGGHLVTIAAVASVTITASKSDCSAPAFANCNFIYSNSSGTVSATTTIATAGAAGNVLLAFVETSGSAITRIAAPNQAWNVFTQNSLGISGGANGAIVPTTAGGTTLGTNALPFSSVFVGAAATNNANITGTMTAARTVTLPDASITVNGAVFISCATSAACSPTTQSSTIKVVYGSAALASGTPSTASISAISPAFTSAATYWCTASPEGTTAVIAAGGIAINKTSGSAFTLTGPNTVTTVIDWVCYGT